MVSPNLTGTVNYKGHELRFKSNERFLTLLLTYEQKTSLMLARSPDGQYVYSSDFFEAVPVIIGRIDGNDETIAFFTGFRHYYSFDLMQSMVIIPIAGAYISRMIPSVFDETDIYFESDQFYRFLDYCIHFRKIGTACVATEQDKGPGPEIDCFEIDNLHISVSAGGHREGGHSPFVKMHVNEQLLAQDVFGLSNLMVHVIQFLFFRKDMCPDTIKVQTKSCQEGGELIIFPLCNQHDNDQLLTDWRDSIPWRIIHPHIGAIFSAIYEGKLVLDYIPDEFIGRIASSFSSIQKDSSSFEASFHWAGAVTLTSDPVREETIKEARRLLNELIEKERKISKKEVIKQLEKMRNNANAISLVDKMVAAFHYYGSCLEPLKRKYAPEYTYEDIARECSAKRNNVIHGDLHKNVSVNTAWSFCLLRAVTLCMQLHACGLSLDEIRLCIDQMYGIQELGQR